MPLQPVKAYQNTEFHELLNKSDVTQIQGGFLLLLGLVPFFDGCKLCYCN